MKLIAVVLAISLLYGCNRQSNSVVTPVDRVTIERISIDGIPAQRINIDQTKKEIVIQIPTTISKVDLPVSYTLGCTDCSATGIPYSLYACIATNSWSVSRPGQQPVSYTVVLQPAGPLTLGPNLTSVISQLGDPYITLPILNYYDGQSDGEVTFRDKATGTVAATRTINCWNGSLNSFNVSASPLLPLGTYTIDVAKKNGRQARFPQLLQVIKGTPRVIYYPQTVLVTTRSISLGGYNLYSTDNLELVLVDSRGTAIKLDQVQYHTDGAGLDIPTWPALTPGYYTFQLVQNGRKLESAAYYSGLIVIESNQQPFLYGFSQADQFTRGPVLLERGKKYETGIPINGSTDTQVSLKLININTQAAVLIPVTLPGGYFFGSTEGTGVSVTIPDTVPPGHYVAYPRYQQVTNVVDGLRYGWDVEIK